jgi:hypothetical protein
MRRIALAVAVACGSLGLAGLAPASAVATGNPLHAPGSVIGDGKPLKAYARIKPTVHLFGDTIHARLTVLADSRYVDPALLSVKATFAPYTAAAAPTLATVHAGRFEQLTWTWTLRCLTGKCLPLGLPSTGSQTFRFPPAQIRYLHPNGKFDYGLITPWPRVQVFSHLSPGVAGTLVKTKALDWQYATSPVAPPTYRVRPTLLFWLAVAAAAVLLVGAVVFATRWYLVVRPRGGRVFEGTPLERALALVTWAHAHGNETLERKAFERVADEIDASSPRDGLSATAHELAWQARLPDDDEVQAFTERARETEPEPVE